MNWCIDALAFRVIGLTFGAVNHGLPQKFVQVNSNVGFYWCIDSLVFRVSGQTFGVVKHSLPKMLVQLVRRLVH